ncbi:hypothetical protein Nhal_2008 [Nitrosococcus halophilus Nc 4]|uniref:Uncharacterized protein n=1 Tax=Nitrosococcus halophilus (strain Nc4) TaxID=472759 RepID=D5C4D1_NITHN|nr:hypothetical protein [Nitrosococcus halophilus]ADE15115.1 hypothetical protein Nhal_2008 [Nitrosococcus halophilus Nc 4]
MAYLAVTLAFFIFFIMGCGTTSPIAGPDRTQVGEIYTVDPQIKWSRFYRRNIEIWTVDGPSLEAIYFVKGIDPDETLVATNEEEKWPKFDPDMTANEIMELIIDSLARTGYTQLQPHHLRPEIFGSLKGFRFDFDFLYQDGLEGQGLVTGTIIENKLYLILYIGTRQHYFSKYLDEVNKIIKSIRLSLEKN